jgi:integrase
MSLCPCGCFVSPEQFNTAVGRLSGIEGFHVHQPRHTFASSGWNAVAVWPPLQQILGHSTIVTTQRYRGSAMTS